MLLLVVLGFILTSINGNTHECKPTNTADCMTESACLKKPGSLPVKNADCKSDGGKDKICCFGIVQD